MRDCPPAPGRAWPDPTPIRLCFLCFSSQRSSSLQSKRFRNAPKAQVLVLGTFHFQDAGRDSYKPQFPFDIRTPQRQRELDEVLAKLAAWKPTRIAIERDVEVQARVDSLFAIYPKNGMDTLRNEIYQVGFKLAKRLNHAGVFGVDSDGAVPRLGHDRGRVEEAKGRPQAGADVGNGLGQAVHRALPDG